MILKNSKLTKFNIGLLGYYEKYKHFMILLLNFSVKQLKQKTKLEKKI